MLKFARAGFEGVLGERGCDWHVELADVIRTFEFQQWDGLLCEWVVVAGDVDVAEVVDCRR